MRLSFVVVGVLVAAITVVLGEEFRRYHTDDDDDEYLESRSLDREGMEILLQYITRLINITDMITREEKSGKLQTCDGTRCTRHIH
ncbi:UNVERIFIED_CONTAM: hypothetical protein PYX00_001047 [Menopon gallinae]|uniref:Uncharacterized protein n=1 Tax=Menopon gallinae TaxID=328185 RepID=A0AAW2IAU4_9NEOP